MGADEEIPEIDAGERLLGKLESARRHLSEGKVARALSVLDQSARAIPDDLPRWLEFLTRAVAIADLCNQIDLALPWIDRTERTIKRLKRPTIDEIGQC